MKINSSTMLFFMTMMLGILMSISSNNWIMIWGGLEISLISIIPLMLNKSIISSESIMKYFIVQSVSSAMLMLSMMIMVMKGDYNYNFMMSTSLLLKMGVAPFHNWVLTVIEGLDLHMMLITLTMNKIAPLILMSYVMKSLTVIILITITTGAVMGINQNSVKKLIGYSSIFNMGFIMSVLKFNLMWMLYLTVYSILLMMLVIIIKNNKISFINQMTFTEFMTQKMSLWMILLSMGGMPPLAGFSIKYMVMIYMISTKMITLIMLMLMMSLIVMFFYLRMTFLSIMNNSIISINKMFHSNELSTFYMMINLTMMPMLISIKIFI